MPHSDEKPLPVLLIFGNEDPLNPVEGGPVTAGGHTIDKPPPMVTARRWAKRYHCTMTLGATVQSIRQTSFHSCDDDVPVALLSIDGLGHHWPGNAGEQHPSPGLGPAVANIKATDVIWDFFARATSPPDESP